MDHGRDPCPWVILNDFGGAFAMGVCSTSTNVIHGIYTPPPLYLAPCYGATIPAETLASKS